MPRQALLQTLKVSLFIREHLRLLVNLCGKLSEQSAHATDSRVGLPLLWNLLAKFVKNGLRADSRRKKLLLGVGQEDDYVLVVFEKFSLFVQLLLHVRKLHVHFLKLPISACDLTILLSDDLLLA